MNKTDFETVNKSQYSLNKDYLTKADMRALIMENSVDYKNLCTDKVCSESWEFLYELYSVLGADFKKDIDLNDLETLQNIFNIFICPVEQDDLYSDSKRINIVYTTRTQLHDNFNVEGEKNLEHIKKGLAKAGQEIETLLNNSTKEYWQNMQYNHLKVSDTPATLFHPQTQNPKKNQHTDSSSRRCVIF